MFYTPDYITDYICRNTIIPYLSKSGKINTVSELIGEYWGSSLKELDLKVRDIKIIDIACGSGAFLNKAADILLEIHVGIHKTRYKDQKETLKPYFDNIGQRREILLNNIYGVDLNEESVDITKLSLFLTVCRKGSKLPDIDKNIKCGNSLIDNPEYTDKPFKWEEEFSEICKGGFDIVIGNPPYVRHAKIKNIKPFLKRNYQTFRGAADLYVYFFEKGLKLLKNGGRFGFISSNKFIKVDYGKSLRKFISEETIFKNYLDLTYDDIFLEATTYPSVFLLNKEKPSELNKILVNDEYEINQSRLTEAAWGFERPEVLKLRDKIEASGIKIKNIPNLNFYIGVFTGYNDAFFIDKTKMKELISKDPRVEEIIKPLIRGKDIKR